MLASRSVGDEPEWTHGGETRHRDRVLARAWTTVLLAGCYAPELQTGAPCVDDRSCPHEQRCVAGRCGGHVAPPFAGSDAWGPLVDAAVDSCDSSYDAPASCTTSDTCQVPEILGTVSADTGNQRLTASGTHAAWLRVRATENDGTIYAVPMRLAVIMTSPPAVAFDVITYLDLGADAVECAAQVGTVATSGNVTRVQLEWGEIGGGFSNGIADDRSVSIEIRPRAACAADQMWTLEVHGNEL